MKNSYNIKKALPAERRKLHLPRVGDTEKFPARLIIFPFVLFVKKTLYRVNILSQNILSGHKN